MTERRRSLGRLASNRNSRCEAQGLPFLVCLLSMTSSPPCAASLILTLSSKQSSKLRRRATSSHRSITHGRAIRFENRLRRPSALRYLALTAKRRFRRTAIAIWGWSASLSFGRRLLLAAATSMDTFQCPAACGKCCCSMRQVAQISLPAVVGMKMP